MWQWSFWNFKVEHPPLFHRPIKTSRPASHPLLCQPLLLYLEYLWVGDNAVEPGAAIVWVDSIKMIRIINMKTLCGWWCLKHSASFSSCHLVLLVIGVAVLHPEKRTVCNDQNRQKQMAFLPQQASWLSRHRLGILVMLSARMWTQESHHQAFCNSWWTFFLRMLSRFSLQYDKHSVAFPQGIPGDSAHWSRGAYFKAIM